MTPLLGDAASTPGEPIKLILRGRSTEPEPAALALEVTADAADTARAAASATAAKSIASLQEKLRGAGANAAGLAAEDCPVTRALPAASDLFKAVCTPFKADSTARSVSTVASSRASLEGLPRGAARGCARVNGSSGLEPSAMLLLGDAAASFEGGGGDLADRLPAGGDCGDPKPTRLTTSRELNAPHGLLRQTAPALRVCNAGEVGEVGGDRARCTLEDTSCVKKTPDIAIVAELN